ncbi:hypothetical protein cypCar_00010029 [Cyprinus carpio]|nr:hypothetical protein cypCar_00010029 [Cyprinus carpio]
MGVTLDSVGFDSELQALYMAVSSGKTGQKRKRSPDSSPAAEDKHVSEHHQHITDVPTEDCRAMNPMFKVIFLTGLFKSSVYHDPIIAEP